MGILDELFSKSTGMKGLLEGTDPNNPGFGGSTESDALQSIVNKQSQPPTNQTEASALQNILANQKRPTNQNIPNQNIEAEGGMVPPKKPDDLSQLNPNLFVKIFGRTKESMSNEWKNKGGFEALMANPGFTLGLSLMKTSAQGKPIGEGMFDAAIKSGAISKQYADRIKERSKVLAPVSDAQRSLVQSVLSESDIGESSAGQKWRSIFSRKNLEASNRRVKNLIYEEAESLWKAEAGSGKGKNVRVAERHIEQAAKNLIKNKKIVINDKGRFSFIFGRGAQTPGDGTPLAKGGPVAAGKDYIVGEEGPEMFVSETNGTIINNDDSKVVSMLLESNPQLKNVSKARAVKILKARFPDYF